MMKTAEELNALRSELEELNKKLSELSEEELKEVTGGWNWGDGWGDDTYFKHHLRGMPQKQEDEKYVIV